MRISGISPWSLLLVVVIMLLVFGTKRLRHVGKDLSTVVKDFRSGLDSTSDSGTSKEGDSSPHASSAEHQDK